MVGVPRQPYKSRSGTITSGKPVAFCGPLVSGPDPAHHHRAGRFWPKRPDLGEGLGKAIKEFRKASTDMGDSLGKEVHTPDTGTVTFTTRRCRPACRQRRLYKPRTLRRRPSRPRSASRGVQGVDPAAWLGMAACGS